MPDKVPCILGSSVIYLVYFLFRLDNVKGDTHTPIPWFHEATLAREATLFLLVSLWTRVSSSAFASFTRGPVPSKLESPTPT